MLVCVGPGRNVSICLYQKHVHVRCVLPGNPQERLQREMEEREQEELRAHLGARNIKVGMAVWSRGVLMISFVRDKCRATARRRVATHDRLTAPLRRPP